MSEDKAVYGKPNCKHEATTPIVNLPGMVRCNECGEVMRPKRTRYEWPCVARWLIEEVEVQADADSTTRPQTAGGGAPTKDEAIPAGAE